MTMRDVRDRLLADDEHKWDTLAERHRIRIHGGRLFFGQMSLQNFPKGLELTPWATAQLCQKLNIPTAALFIFRIHRHRIGCGNWRKKSKRTRRRNGCSE